MKVKLATQTFSKSLTDALLLLCTDLKLPEFQGAEETVNLILMICLISSIEEQLLQVIYIKDLCQQQPNLYFLA